MEKEEILFEINTPLEFTVRCEKSYWDRITTFKHPVMRGQERDVIETLRRPEEVRRSKKDPSVLLFYRISGKRYVCAVTKKEDHTGFLITAYHTDSIKEGERIWIK